MINIALVGNPNTGKSTLFNALTGLNQKVGNFSGVTIERKTGVCILGNGNKAEITDLPGCYSLYPRAVDESIAINELTKPDAADIVLVVVDASNLKRNLLLFSQIRDLGCPIILVLNMIDMAESHNISIDVNTLAKHLGVPVVPVNARKSEGIAELKQAIIDFKPNDNQKPIFEIPIALTPILEEVKGITKEQNLYKNFALLHYPKARYLTVEHNINIKNIALKYKILELDYQIAETIARYDIINDWLSASVKLPQISLEPYSNKIDKVLTHPVLGISIFFAILFMVFQAIFSWAQYPMDGIENGINIFSDYLNGILPQNFLTSMLCNGILPGLAGILVFIPQICILFGFIAILEDTGYMARVSFLMDRIMHKVGMNGKSIVPLIGGLACAVPAIMAARTIEDKKERLITILIMPLISCSARLPVYTLMVALVVPHDYFWGFVSLQGLVLLGLYLIGFFSAIALSLILHFWVLTKQKSYFLLELPTYRMPRWRFVGYNIFNQVKSFVTDAGKIILLISIILWYLVSYGPGDNMASIEKKYSLMSESAMNQANKNAERMEASYAAYMGKAIEPAIAPLGYDWKIGIALITSFAAREVFVGTMATIYSANDGNNLENTSLKSKMQAAKHQISQRPVYDLRTGFSLLIFYAFALQCLSTMAVTRKETKSWKLPILQWIGFTAFAYGMALLVYNIV